MFMKCEGRSQLEKLGKKSVGLGCHTSLPASKPCFCSSGFLRGNFPTNFLPIIGDRALLRSIAVAAGTADPYLETSLESCETIGLVVESQSRFQLHLKRI